MTLTFEIGRHVCGAGSLVKFIAERERAGVCVRAEINDVRVV